VTSGDVTALPPEPALAASFRKKNFVEKMAAGRVHPSMMGHFHPAMSIRPAEERRMELWEKATSRPT